MTTLCVQCETRPRRGSESYCGPCINAIRALYAYWKRQKTRVRGKGRNWSQWRQGRAA